MAGVLEGAVMFLAGRGAVVDVAGVPTTVAVSGPLDLPPSGDLPPLCILQAAGPAGDEALGLPGRTVLYTIRFYGPDDVTALAAHAAVQAATYANIALRIPVMHTMVAGKVLRWFTISEPTGPIPEPETGRQVVLATGRGKWSS